MNLRSFYAYQLTSVCFSSTEVYFVNNEDSIVLLGSFWTSMLVYEAICCERLFQLWAIHATSSHTYIIFIQEKLIFSLSLLGYEGKTDLTLNQPNPSLQMFKDDFSVCFVLWLSNYEVSILFTTTHFPGSSFIFVLTHTDNDNALWLK